MSQHYRSGRWTSSDFTSWKPRVAFTLLAPCVDASFLVAGGTPLLFAQVRLALPEGTA